MARYIVADPDVGPGWTHIWRIQEAAGRSIDVERSCRFAFDRRLARLVKVDIDVDGIMVPASEAEKTTCSTVCSTQISRRLKIRNRTAFP
ncbi:hypothetical protein QA649_37495 [Bradyrhizobium sp. CB1717]|uniref:hypothetical protein n=1 Tax=Bradyrhizobium sp. CB1717 TaxID=3039154 RepID=UPI0024B056E3|nr:hypothetical protein [Bradyrhizobium sp. CB1717]WFU23648.1 hypothetical protein QA649_37495 [Bradyrhizobium sp. CB1717]